MSRTSRASRKDKRRKARKAKWERFQASQGKRRMEQGVDRFAGEGFGVFGFEDQESGSSAAVVRSWRDHLGEGSKGVLVLDGMLDLPSEFRQMKDYRVIEPGVPLADIQGLSLSDIIQALADLPKIDAYAPDPGESSGLSCADLQTHMHVFGLTGSGMTNDISTRRKK